MIMIAPRPCSMARLARAAPRQRPRCTPALPRRRQRSTKAGARETQHPDMLKSMRLLLLMRQPQLPANLTTTASSSDPPAQRNGLARRKASSARRKRLRPTLTMALTTKIGRWRRHSMTLTTRTFGPATASFVEPKSLRGKRLAIGDVVNFEPDDRDYCCALVGPNWEWLAGSHFHDILNSSAFRSRSRHCLATRLSTMPKLPKSVGFISF
jgi:hypothetical protein